MKRPVLSALLLALSLTACAPRAQERTIFAMNTVMDLSVYGTADDIQAVEDRLNGLDRTLSVTRPESEVWAINHAQGAPVSVSQDVSRLIETAQTLGEQTGGALDVTLYPVVKAWGFTTEEHHVPSGQELAALLTKVDYSALSLDDTTLTLPAGMELDFGSLAKGYAGEVCADLLRDRGVASALLYLGGNIQTVGSRPDGHPWSIGLQDPEDTDHTLGILQLTDQAAVTSGGYQRYFESDGVRYWHILDPATGAPARTGLTSVTIVAHSGTLCDGLSTALFVLGREEALNYWRAHRDFEAVLLDEEHNAWITPGLSDRFTLSENSNYTLHIVEE